MISRSQRGTNFLKGWAAPMLWNFSNFQATFLFNEECLTKESMERQRNEKKRIGITSFPEYEILQGSVEKRDIQCYH